MATLITPSANLIANAGTIVLAKEGAGVAAGSLTINGGAAVQVGGTATNQVGTLVLNDGTVDLNGENQTFPNRLQTRLP